MLKKSVTFVFIVVTCLTVLMLGGCGSKTYNYSYSKSDGASTSETTDLTETVNVILPSVDTELSRRKQTGEVITKVKVDSIEMTKEQIAQDVVLVDVTFNLIKTEDSKGDGATQTCSFILKLFKDEGADGTTNFVRAETKKSSEELMMIGDGYTYTYSFKARVEAGTVRNFKIELFDEIV